MRKFLIFLALLMLISASASAYVVTPSKTPNTKLGNAQGLYSVGTIKAPDLYATDDLLVVDDAQIYDDLIVNGTLTVGVFSTAANVTTGHVTEDLTMDSGVDITAASGAEIFNYGSSTGAFTTGTGTNTLSGNTVISGSKTFTTGTGAVSLAGDSTVASNKALAVTTADKLTVGGVIVPQEMVITVPIGTSAVDQTVFIADDAWQITKIEEVHTVAQNTAFPNTGSLSVMKCTGTQAPGSGTAFHNTTMYLNSTVETVVTPTLTGATGDLNLADGNRIALNFNGTMTTFAGGCVTIHLKRI